MSISHIALIVNGTYLLFYHLPISTLENYYYYYYLLCLFGQLPSDQPFKKRKKWLLLFFLFVCLFVMPPRASPLFTTFTHQLLKKIICVFFVCDASLAILLFYYLLTWTFKKLLLYFFVCDAYLGISPFYYFLASTLKYYYFICLLYCTIAMIWLFGKWTSIVIPDIGPGDLGSIPGRVIPKTQKMVLDASLLNTQHYKVRNKGKVEQFREWVAPSPTLWCSSYRKWSLRVTLDYGRQLYLLTYLHRLSITHLDNMYT